MRLVPVVVLTLVLGGCASASVLTLDGPAREPSDPASVQLLLDPPSRPYSSVALIRSSQRNIFNDMEELKRQIVEEAARLGADAVILGLSGSGSDGTAIRIGESSFLTDGGDSLRLIGRAIVFLDGNG